MPLVNTQEAFNIISDWMYRTEERIKRLENKTNETKKTDNEVLLKINNILMGRGDSITKVLKCKDILSKLT